MTDKHLKDIISRFGFRGKVLDGICIEIKEAIRLDTEAERLFCKQIVADKIAGKGVEGEQFGTGEK